jgi:hypothetical protein
MTFMNIYISAVEMEEVGQGRAWVVRTRQGGGVGGGTDEQKKRPEKDAAKQKKLVSAQ